MKTEQRVVCHAEGSPWTTEEIEIDEPHAHEVQVETRLRRPRVIPTSTSGWGT